MPNDMISHGTVCGPEEAAQRTDDLGFLKKGVMKHSHLQCFINHRKRLQRPFQNTMHMCDGSSVVRDGHAAVAAVADAGFHFTFVQHAASAVDDQSIPG